MVKKNYDDMLICFHMIPERYGQTDKQTDKECRSHNSSLVEWLCSVCSSAYVFQSWCHVWILQQRHIYSVPIISVPAELVRSHRPPVRWVPYLSCACVTRRSTWLRRGRAVWTWPTRTRMRSRIGNCHGTSRIPWRCRSYSAASCGTLLCWPAQSPLRSTRTVLYISNLSTH